MPTGQATGRVKGIHEVVRTSGLLMGGEDDPMPHGGVGDDFFHSDCLPPFTCWRRVCA